MQTRTDLYDGLFRWNADPDGLASVSRHDGGPTAIPWPAAGRALRVATIDAQAAAICPRCDRRGHGGFVSFDGDFRKAYACPGRRELIWFAGA